DEFPIVRLADLLRHEAIAIVTRTELPAAIRTPAPQRVIELDAAGVRGARDYLLPRGIVAGLHRHRRLRRRVVAELAVRVEAPAEHLAALDAARVKATGRDRAPSDRRQLDRHQLHHRRAIAELAVTVIAPAPQLRGGRGARVNRARVAEPRRHLR